MLYLYSVLFCNAILLLSNPLYINKMKYQLFPVAMSILLGATGLQYDN